MRFSALFLAAAVLLSACSLGPSPENAKAALDAMKAKGRLDDVSETNFVYCAFMSDLQAVNLYLASGMSPNVRNKEGRTPLMGAAAAEPQSPWIGKNADVIALLLKKGADVNAKDNAGDSAVKLAQAIGRAQTVAALKAAGATD